MKKQILTVFLALALCMGLAIPAFAADEGKTTPVRVGDVSFSDVVITDRYESYLHNSSPVEEGCYDLGKFRIVDNSGEQDYQTLGIFIIPDDAEITFHLSKGHTAARVFQLSVKEDEPIEGVKAYTATQTGYISNQPLDTTVTLNKKMLDSLSKDGEKVPYDLLACGVSNSAMIFVMFESKTAALGEPLPAQPAAPSFTDVSADAWYAGPVAWAVNKGITNGTTTTTFSPAQDCTHAQILTFLHRAAGKPTASAKAPITVAASYADAVDWAYEQGMIDDSFDPSAPCTRSQAVSYIWQALGGPDAKASSFTDVPAGASYAKAVDWAVEKGVTDGDGSADTFSPDKVCSRGHIVTFLYRAYEN